MGNLLSRVTAKKLVKKLEAPELMYTMPARLEKEDEALLALLRDLPGPSLLHLLPFERTR